MTRKSNAVRNRKPRPSSSPVYRSVFVAGEGPKGTYLLLTPIEYSRAKERARRNPEDCR